MSTLLTPWVSRPVARRKKVGAYMEKMERAKKRVTTVPKPATLPLAGQEVTKQTSDEAAQAVAAAGGMDLDTI